VGSAKEPTDGWVLFSDTAGQRAAVGTVLAPPPASNRRGCPISKPSEDSPPRSPHPLRVFTARFMPEREVITKEALVCDYSLHNFASRPARIGDELITTEFRNSVTCGFSAIGEPDVAVCLLPGTEVALAKEPEHRNRLLRLFPGLGFGKLSGKVARFRQINLDNPHTHHDALEFADGKVVLLTFLRPGQRATVLQLPTHAGDVNEKSRNEHLALIS
jgi:hypothetical protein